MHSENTASADFDAAYAVSPGDDSVAATDDTLIDAAGAALQHLREQGEREPGGREVVDLR